MTTTLFPKPLLSKVEVCDLLDASPRTLDRLRKLGRVPQPVRIGRREYWRAADLEAFLTSLS